MKKLLGIITLLMVVLPLTHCGLLDDDSAAIVPVVPVSEKIGCLGLDGAYKTRADLFFNLIPSSQDYNVNIASGANDVIFQIESVEESEEKNVVCVTFPNVELAPEGTLPRLTFNAPTSRIAATNNANFVTIATSFHTQTTGLDSTSSCVAKDIFLKEDVTKLRSEKTTLTPDAERSAKSFKTIKEECDSLVLVETDEEEAEDVTEAAPAEAAPVKEAPAEEFVGPPAS